MNNVLLDHDACINILLVENNEDDYIFIKELLDGISETRFQVDWVDSYEAGMESCHDGRYDVFLIDYNLGHTDNGGKNGIELMRDLFRRECSKKIIILTGREDHNIDLEAINVDAFDYLVKDEIEPSVLERAIRYAFSRGRIENLLTEKENHYQTILDNIDEYIYLKDIPEESFPYGRIHFISSRVKTVTGYDAAEFMADPNFIQRIVHPDDFRQLRKTVGVPDANNSAEHSILSFEFRIRHKNTGEYRWMEDKIVPYYDDNRNLIGYIGVVRDVAERRMFEDQLKHDVLHDKLTGLPNRVLFMDRLLGAMSRGKRRSDYQFAVLFIDLDRFKNINDAMGHTCGDKLLMAVTERLRAFVRPSDTSARLGTDGFAILLDEIPYAYDATFVADRIQELLSTPVMIDNYEMFSTPSIGIALSASGYQHPEEMLRDADTAMYKAKPEGRAHYEVFDMEMHTQATSI